MSEVRRVAETVPMTVDLLFELMERARQSGLEEAAQAADTYTREPGNSDFARGVQASAKAIASAIRRLASPSPASETRE